MGCLGVVSAAFTVTPNIPFSLGDAPMGRPFQNAQKCFVAEDELVASKHDLFCNYTKQSVNLIETNMLV